MTDFTPYNPFQLCAKDLTMRKWQVDLERRAQEAQDRADAAAPRNDQMSQALMKIGVNPK